MCGGRLNKAKGKAQPVYSCSEHSEDLQAFVGIPSHTEEDITLPSKFCNQCHVKVVRAKKASKDGLPFQPIIPMEWPPHQDHCKVRSNKNNNNNIIIIIIIMRHLVEEKNPPLY